MELTQAILNRHSYRGMYLPDPVPRSHLQKILEAGLAAPSGCNLQSVHLVAVDDPTLMGEIGGMLHKPGFASAPAAVVVFSKMKYAADGHEYRAQDYAAAIENMLLTITDLGYASCWVEGYVRFYENIAEKLARALKAPQDWHAVAYLPVGRPAQPVQPTAKAPFEERAGFNAF